MSTLDPDRLGEAMHIIAAWRVDPDGKVPCPQCHAGGLVITDCSARPHAEWYRLHCGTCGLEHMLNIPLGAGGPSAY